MRLRTMAAVMSAITLSAFVHAQPIDIRDNDGRLVTAARVLNPKDVSRASALYGITVFDAPDGKSVIVSAIATPRHQGSTTTRESRLLAVSGLDGQSTKYRRTDTTQNRKTV